jgi:predicted ATP-binding protein involved in virulence
VDLDFRIAKGTREEKTRYKHLLETYQRIIRRVTGKIKLEYVGIENNRVMFDTDDGKVRVEAVSQGTASLMGWIGYLVERLYEVYDQSKDPTKEYALVLVDEIDAHMHPEWQRQLTGHLKKIFPKVQFIATTHSPLIPVTLTPEEVLRLRRDAQNPSLILVERMDVDMRRWQANQVLTSPLFDLGSTMAPEMEEAMENYTSLVWRQDLSAEEQKTLEQASALLRVRLPLSMEREEARLAYQLIEAALVEKIKEIPAEKQKKVLDEVRVQMLENVTGSRRPV